MRIVPVPYDHPDAAELMTAVQQVYVEGMQLINATSYPTGAAPFKEFKFGFMQFHGPERKIWYDDIVVSPTRSPCPIN